MLLPDDSLKFKQSLALWFGLLVTACCIAYAAQGWLRPQLPRLANHALYLGWLVSVGIWGRWLFGRLRLLWPQGLWSVLYGAGILYLVGMETVSFLLPAKAKWLQSSIAHTAFLLSSPLPFAALICLYVALQRKK